MTDQERRLELLKNLYNLRKGQSLVPIGCNAFQDEETKEDIRFAKQLRATVIGNTGLCSRVDLFVLNPHNALATL